MNRLRLFNAVAVSMLVAGILLVGLALVTVQVLDRGVIEAAAARNRHAEFLRASTVVGREIVRPEDIRDTEKMKNILEDIQDLRPGIQALEVIEFVNDGARPVTRTGSGHPAKLLSEQEIQAVRGNNVISYFEESDRGWIFTVPIVSNGNIVGALHGKFSVSKYDQLIEAQEQVAKQVAVAAVILTCLTMLLLIRIQLHRPIARLLATMDEIRSGNWALEAPVTGPLEIRRLAENFNQMIAQLHSVMRDKEQLLTEIRTMNSNLESRVLQAVHDLEREKDKVVLAQLVAQRNSNLAALGEVSAIMAHELGNPLNAMYGRLQLMKSAMSQEDRARHFEAIKGQVTRMSDVIQHILRSTRIEGEASAVQMNDVIAEVIALLQAPTITVATHLTADLPPVAVNKTAFHGVVTNLVNNAVQAMNGKGELTLMTSLINRSDLEGHVIVQAVSSSEPMVRMAVADSGSGIPDHVLQRICEPFFTTRHDEGGTGLGLAICRRVIASAGGRLAVNSPPGKGTIFTVDLPLWRRSA
jgi:signal transduction histidine kinase